MDMESFMLGAQSAGGGGGRTDDYNDLNNLPQVNGVELKGNKTSEDLGIEQIQVSTMPEASASLVGKIVQFTGATGTYTNGYFYKCVENDGVYSWEASNTQAGGGSSNTFNEDDFVVEDNEVSLTPEQRTFTGTTEEWEALTAEEKALYGTVQLTDDDSADYKDVYSTSEVKTNKVWIDGKPIHRKVLVIPSLPDGNVNYPHGVSNIDALVRVEFTAVWESGEVTTVGGYTIPKGINYTIAATATKTDVIVRTGGDRSDLHGYVILEYTKTTD